MSHQPCGRPVHEPSASIRRAARRHALSPDCCLAATFCGPTHMNDGSSERLLVATCCPMLQHAVLCCNVLYCGCVLELLPRRSIAAKQGKPSAHASRIRCSSVQCSLHVLHRRVFDLQGCATDAEIAAVYQISAGTIHVSLIRLCSASVPPKQTMRTAPVAFGGSHTCPTGSPPTSAPCISHAGGSPVSSVAPVRPSLTLPRVRTGAEVPACR